MKWKNCKHDWVRSGFGDDLICKKCGYAAMQARMTMPVSESAMQPVIREKVEVPFYTGSEHVRVSVYKDDLMEQIQKEIGLSINHFSNRLG